jgi:hypothetical protein
MPGKPYFHFSLKMRRLAFLPLITVLVLAACAAPGVNPSPPGPTAVASSFVPADATPTATIVWFPPTSTWTPFPTPQISPTLEALPGLGVDTFSDDFSDAQDWQGAKSESEGGNSIIVNRNRLTLAVNVPPVYLFSLRNDLQLTDFYAETTVNVNRCEGADIYGMLFRAAGNADSYRYALACNGQVRVERLQANKVNVLQDWLPSGDAPLGAPGEVRLGVWISGVEMRFFLNGRYQFSVIDPVFHSGTLGVFVDSANPVGMNISFSNLVVHDVAYVSPTPSPLPSKTPTATRTRNP